MRSIVFSALFLALFLTFNPSVSAHHRSKVLGVSTESSNVLQMPATPQGPGLILPDSPLFFLDNIKQNIRIFTALTPEAKANVYKSIAGERLAELRFMINKNNQQGIDTALSGVSYNLEKSSEQLTQAKLSGRNVSELAKSINKDIKEKQDILNVLDSQAEGEMKGKISATWDSLLETKVEVEDSLPEEELDNEIRDDLNRKTERQVREAADNAEELEADLNELNAQASEAAQKSLKVREDALKKAIEEKNETLKKTNENLYTVEKNKQEKLIKVQAQAAEEAKKAIEKAQEAAVRFEEVNKKTEEIRNETPVANLTPSPSRESEN